MLLIVERGISRITERSYAGSGKTQFVTRSTGTNLLHVPISGVLPVNVSGGRRGIGQDADGELYVIRVDELGGGQTGSGVIFKVTP